MELHTIGIDLAKTVFHLEFSCYLRRSRLRFELWRSSLEYSSGIRVVLLTLACYMAARKSQMTEEGRSLGAPASKRREMGDWPIQPPRVTSNSYWHCVKASGWMVMLLPPTDSAYDVVFFSEGEQSAAPPEEGTKASPSMT